MLLLREGYVCIETGFEKADEYWVHESLEGLQNIKQAWNVRSLEELSRSCMDELGYQRRAVWDNRVGQKLHR